MGDSLVACLMMISSNGPSLHEKEEVEKFLLAVVARFKAFKRRAPSRGCGVKPPQRASASKANSSVLSQLSGLENVVFNDFIDNELLAAHAPSPGSCSRCAGLQQCKSFVEMCIVSCLSSAPACVCERGLQPGAALVVVCLAVVTLPALPHQRWLVVVWLAVVSSADGLYAVALWRGCRGTSASAWGPFWPPIPRP